MISSVDLAHYAVSCAKDWVSVDCGTTNLGREQHIIMVHVQTNRICSSKNIFITFKRCLCFARASSSSLVSKERKKSWPDRDSNPGSLAYRAGTLPSELPPLSLAC